ncbi:MAG: hypothetical protein KYX62_07880 [Pseudomonadota bacterium]|nr:hypothetical protein [Pseudomonadota bacterium]
MASYTLFIYEGEKTERHIHESMVSAVLNDVPNTVELCAYCTHIYTFSKKLREDEDLDAFVLLSSMPKNKHLKGIRRSQVSEIYLFFDYDGHVDGASDETLQGLLEVFCDETDKGRLYFSYPMVEALKHAAIRTCFSKEFAASQRRYKNDVKEICKRDNSFYNNLIGLRSDHWKLLVERHLMKANSLVYGDYILPEGVISQQQILDKQIEKHIQPNGKVSVLSAFPLFLLEYYGIESLLQRFQLSR